MVSMVFLTMAIFAVLSVNSYTLRASQGNRNREIANRIACTQLSVVESILKINFHTPTGSITTPLLVSNQFPEFQYKVEDLGYEDNYVGGMNLRRVQCRVFWYAEGVQQGYALWTVLYNY